MEASGSVPGPPWAVRRRRSLQCPLPVLNTHIISIIMSINLNTIIILRIVIVVVAVVYVEGATWSHGAI